MIKRVALARALALDPEIVFLDEPTSGLDPIGAADFDELIRTLQRTLGLTVFMVTHDLDSLHAVCDRIAVLVRGSVIADRPDGRDARVRASMAASRISAANAGGKCTSRQAGTTAVMRPRSRARTQWKRSNMETRANYIVTGAFTLAVIAGVFGFIYWFQNSAAAAASARVYRVVFAGSVSGLRTGASVLFNGMRVGEVTGLALDRARSAPGRGADLGRPRRRRCGPTPR